MRYTRENEQPMRSEEELNEVRDITRKMKLQYEAARAREAENHEDKIVQEDTLTNQKSTS